MPAIYLTKQGTAIAKERGRMSLFEDQEELFSTPWSQIDSLIIFGNIQISSQVIATLLNKGIDTAFLSMEGKLKGMLIPQKSKNVPLRIKQYEYARDLEIAFRIAKEIVAQKISNQLSVIQDFKKNHPEVDFNDSINIIQAALDNLKNISTPDSDEYSIEKDNSIHLANDLPEYKPAIEEKSGSENAEYDNSIPFKSLRGYEGISSKHYFKCMRDMFTSDIQFNGRNRRPPKDEANALLSFGYTLLGIKISALLYAIGFEPYIGFLHAIDYGRESLMLDILELFRQPAVDKLVLNMCNKKMLKKEDFEEREGGIFLKIESMGKFIREFENWIGVQRFEENTFYQKITKEIHNLSKSILNDIPYRTVSN